MARVPVTAVVFDPATGAAIAGASARVRHRDTGADRTLYAAETGPTTVANPLTTDAYGRAAAWVDRAPLRIDYSGSGLTPFTEYRDIGPSSDRGIDELLLPQGALPTVVTSLPSSPVDGQEVYYVADAATGVVWHLRYSAASSSPYKWEFLGGPPVSFFDSAQVTTTSTTWVASGGSTLTLALAGDYELEQGARMATNTAGVVPWQGIGLNGANEQGGRIDGDRSGSTQVVSSFGRRRINGLTAGTVLRHAIAVSAAATGYFNERHLAARPIRVG